MDPAHPTHRFEIERTRSGHGYTSAYLLGYAYAKSLFSKENPPEIIHLEGQRGHGKSSFAMGVAAACTGQKDATESNELSRHFNWAAQSGDRHVTLLDASTLKHPDTNAIFEHIDSFIRPGAQIMMIEHASGLIDEQFRPDSPLRDRASRPDLRIHLGEPDATNKQTVTIEVLNPETVNPDGLARLEQQFQSKMPWCRPVTPGNAP